MDETATMLHDDESLLRIVAEAAWNASRDERGARCHQRGTCPTRVVPYGPADPNGQKANEVCQLAGCLDLLHDLIVRVQQKLKAGSGLAAADDPSAYAFRVARNELVELGRSERAALGFPAKPSRSDGVVAHVNAALGAVGGPRADWLVALFRIMRCYPFSPQHIPGRWPLDGLVLERERHLPDEVSTQLIVRSEIARVLGVATEVAGQAWVYTTVTLPLNANDNRQELRDDHPDPACHNIDEVMGSLLRGAYQAHRMRGLSRDEAFTRASVEVTGRRAPHQTPALRTARADLEPRRLLVVGRGA